MRIDSYILTALCLFFGTLCVVTLMIYADVRLAEYFRYHPDFGSWKSSFSWVDALGEPQWYIALMGLLACFFRKSQYDLQRKWFFISMNVATIGVLSFVLKFLCGRARPGLYFLSGMYGFFPDIFRFNPSYMSFPSGHAAVVFAFAFALGACFPYCRAGLLVFATLVSTSRVILTWHYISDVLVGAWLAFLLTPIIQYWYDKDVTTQS